MVDETFNDGTIKCSRCGKFIAFKDFDGGKAVRFQTAPDSVYDVEEWENYCPKYWKLECGENASI